MPNWIVSRRNDNGVIDKVDGIWSADDAKGAIARMCAERGKTDDGHWDAEQPEDQAHIINWALDAESRGLPKRSPTPDPQADHKDPHHE